MAKSFRSQLTKGIRRLQNIRSLAFVPAGAALVLLLLAERSVLFLELGSMADRIIILACFLLLFALTLFLLHRSGFASGLQAMLYSSLPVALAFYLRALSMDHVTQDYTYFLSAWVDFFRTNGGFRAIALSVGDYNVPYLYFLALISYLKIPDLYLIKLLSVFFDILLAFWGMKLAGILASGKARPLAAFFLLLLLPTVILNGAYWGQCDSIYGAFAVLSLYLALSDRPAGSVAAIAASFAFKLQAIFLIPIYFVFLFTRRIRLRHIPVFPLTYLWVVVPAILLGKPLTAILSVYTKQAETYTDRLTLNAPSIYALLSSNTVFPSWYPTAGILAAFACVAAAYLLLFLFRSTVNNRVLFLSALLCSLGVPLLLPYMHERYFFLADVLSLILACVAPRRFFLPVLVVFASYLGYHAYLNMQYLLPLRYGTAALGAAAAVLLWDLFSLLRQNGKARGEV